MLLRIRQELASFTASERLFVFFAMLTGFSISAEYGITRPASNSLFLTLFSSQAFPWIWLPTGPLHPPLLTPPNYLLPRIGPWKTLCAVACTVICINSATGLLLPYFPALICIQFAWKDIYVLLMFKQLWSLIHSTISATRAKYLYGAIFGMGTIGSIFVALIPGFFAAQIGSEQIFFFTGPLYTL